MLLIGIARMLAARVLARTIDRANIFAVVIIDGIEFVVEEYPKNKKCRLDMRLKFVCLWFVWEGSWVCVIYFFSIAEEIEFAEVNRVSLKMNKIQSKI